jgi:hypothetical protein
VLTELCLPNLISRRLGVTESELMRWVDAPTASFPLPVASLIDAKGREKPLWNLRQLPELREWVAQRLALSDPAAHWLLIDNGGKPPGGHQDQGALFDTEGTE